MDSATTLARLRTTAASAGTLLLLSAAFAMYQMTSLTLGSQPSRQFNLSLSTPSVDLQEEGSPFGSNRGAMLGELAAISGPRLVARTVPAARAVHTASVAPPATRPSTDPMVILETETDTVAGTNYHDPDVRGHRLARGRRPGSRG